MNRMNQMYIYLLNNGEKYANYGIVGIVLSHTPLDWDELKPKMAAWLNENYLVPDDGSPDTGLFDYFNSKFNSGFATDEMIDKMINECLVAFGIERSEYIELSFDPRCAAWDGQTKHDTKRWIISE